MRLPRLHVVTSDAIICDSGFPARADALMERFGPEIGLHLRARTLSGRVLHGHAMHLAAAALRTGAVLFINERVDLALAARCGAHLNTASIPLPEARRLLHRAPLGYSAHTPDEAVLARAEGADYVFLGTIFATASHPDVLPAGPDLVRRTAARLTGPLVAIGGITPERVAEVRAAGAYGVAVISGVWGADDPPGAAQQYMEALQT